MIANSPDTPAPSCSPERSARLATLTQLIDWAEGEAAALDAIDAGICLQLARLALQARGIKS